MIGADTKPGSENLSGSVERVIARNDVTSWSVLKVIADGEERTLVGLIPQVDEGLQISAEGAWHKHPKFGKQFKATNVRLYAPTSKNGIERFLRSGAVKGIGKKFASMIVSRFGDKTLSVIEKDSWRLKKLKGIGEGRIEAVRAGVKEYRGRMETMSFLHSKLGPIRAQRVYQKYGDESRKRIAENPYRLIDDFERFGFAIADEVAKDVGVAKDNPMRLRAAVLTVLEHAAQRGHTCLSVEESRSETEKLLGTDELANKAVQRESEELPWQRVMKEGEAYLELKKFRYLDEQVAKALKMLIAGPVGVPPIDAEKAIPWAAEKVGLSFEEGQARAIETALSAKLSILTGGPGVGKTTILNALLRVFKAKRYRVSLAAPTGRAARRMSESTGEPAETLHKLLEYSPRAGGFLRKQANPLSLDILIIDEGSMADLGLMKSTLAAVPRNAKVVIVGDREQLPSVGPGQVLADLIESGCVPVARLTKPYRQAAGSAIVYNAHRVNAGDVPDLMNGSADFSFYSTKNATQTAEVMQQVICDELPAEGIDPIRDVMCLSPMHAGPAGVVRLNEALKARLNGSPTVSMTHGKRSFGAGDKVVQLTNDRELAVFNGDTGIVAGLDNDKKELKIEFDQGVVDYPFGNLSSLAHAFCSTVHKAQGGEAPVVVVAVDMSNAVLLSRKLLYTAITRAKKRVILVGQERAVHIAVSEARAHARNTLLTERVIDAFEA